MIHRARFALCAGLLNLFCVQQDAVAQLQTLPLPAPPAKPVTVPPGSDKIVCAVSRLYPTLHPYPTQPPAVELRFWSLAHPFHSGGQALTAENTAPLEPQRYADIALAVFSLRDAPPPDRCSNPPAQIPNPVPIDPAPIMSAAVAADRALRALGHPACINVTSPPAGTALLAFAEADFNCEGLAVNGRVWSVRGTMQVNTLTTFSAHFIRPLTLETASAYRSLSGNYSTNGTSTDVDSWALFSAGGLTDEGRETDPAMGGDGRTWTWTTTFANWPVPGKCPWQKGEIKRKAEVSGVGALRTTHYDLNITVAAACRSIYSWR